MVPPLYLPLFPKAARGTRRAVVVSDQIYGASEETSHEQCHVVPLGACPPTRWTITHHPPGSPAHFVATYIFLQGCFSSAILYGRGLCGGGGRPMRTSRVWLACARRALTTLVSDGFSRYRWEWTAKWGSGEEVVDGYERGG